MLPRSIPCQPFGYPLAHVHEPLPVPSFQGVNAGNESTIDGAWASKILRSLTILAEGEPCIRRVKEAAADEDVAEVVDMLTGGLTWRLGETTDI